jgi:predicted outer membrane repeat protein
MTFNCAVSGGGALYAGGDECSITTAGSTLSSNSAIRGGAIYAGGGSTMARDCTMTSNLADEGGAVYAGGESTFTATKSTILFNSAKSQVLSSSFHPRRQMIDPAFSCSGSGGWCRTQIYQ